MVTELTVILKDEEKTFRQKHLIYDVIRLNDDEIDEKIAICIEEAKKNFQGEPTDVQIKTKTTL